MALYISFLGTPQLFSGKKLVKQLPKKAAVMAAYLAVSGQSVDRSVLADLLWEGEEEAVRRNLRQELFRLKDTPWEHVFSGTASTVSLGSLETDLNFFQAALRGGQWEKCLDLWRGGFLAGLEAKGSESLWDWLLPERERWDRLYREALVGLARSQEASSKTNAAIETYRKLLALDPLQEEEQQALIRLLVSSGDRNGALLQYESYRTLLSDQLKLEPSAEIRELFDQIHLGDLPRISRIDGISRVLSEPQLVGRVEDWAWLEANWGKGLVLLQAEAGVGKSRLANEFSRRRGTTLYINQRETAQGIGFSGVASAIRIQLEGGTLVGLEPGWMEVLGEVLPELGSGSQEVQKSRLFEGLARVLFQIVGAGGVIVWEDLHWIDWASIEFLPYLVHRARVLGFYVLCTSRPAMQSGMAAVFRELKKEGLLQQRDLKPLSKPALLELIRLLSNQSSGGENFTNRLFASTEGNPFYALETLRYLFDQNLLEEKNGVWTTPYDGETTDYQELPLPPTVKDSFLGRLDFFGESSKSLVQLLALADAPLSPDAMVGLLQTAGAQIGDLEAVFDAGFLNQDLAGYTLRHDLFKSALLDEISDTRRTWLHRQLAETLKAVGSPPSAVAYHLEASGQKVLAAEMYVLAARNIRKGPLAKQSLDYFEKAKQLMGDGASDQIRFQLLADIIETRILIGQVMIPELPDLRRLAGGLGSDERYRTALIEAELSLLAGTVEKGIASVQQALELAQTAWQRGHALFRLAWLEYRGGDPDAQLEPLMEAIFSFRAIGDVAMEARAIRNLSGYWLRIGNVEKHELYFEQAYKLATEMEDFFMIRRLMADRAQICWLRGDYLECLEKADQLLEDASLTGDSTAHWDAVQLHLQCAAVWGMDPALEQLARDSIAQADSVGAARSKALLTSWLGTALLIENRISEGVEELSSALEQFKILGEKAYLGHTLFFLGFTKLEEAGGLEDVNQTIHHEAIDLLQQASDIWQDRKEYRQQAKALAGLAYALGRGKDVDGARKMWERAYDMRTEWAKGIHDLPWVVYSKSLDPVEGTKILEEAKGLLLECANKLPEKYQAKMFSNRLVAWAMAREK